MAGLEGSATARSYGRQSSAPSPASRAILIHSEKYFSEDVVKKRLDPLSLHLETKEQLMEAYSDCAVNVGGGISSLSTVFWYLKKPVILLRGRVSRNPFRGLGWQRIKIDAHTPLFNRVLDESDKISHWKQFTKELVLKARWAPSSQGMFYPWNFDREATILKIKEYVNELESTNNSRT